MLAITPNASNFIILFLASVLKDSSWIKFFPLSAKYSIAHTHLSISALASLMALPISFVAVLERFSLFFLNMIERINTFLQVFHPFFVRISGFLYNGTYIFFCHYSIFVENFLCCRIYSY